MMLTEEEAIDHMRLENLMIAKHRGISTWVSCEPVMDESVIFAAIEHYDFIDMYRIGKLNHQKSGIDWYTFGHRAESLCQEHSRNYYIKEDLRAEMEKEK